MLSAKHKKRRKNSETILVTGAAGFIGSHVTRALLLQGYKVVAVDNMNEYYDPRLKRARLALFKKDIAFYKLNIADRVALEKVFKKHKIDKICHLAAQGGVRYSIENPFVYGESNVVGTINIFELAKRNGITHVVFASSSSIYGLNTIPFRESDDAQTPISIYAATKRAGELIAHNYCHLFGLNITCLRFFTVYGPWGRPDMSPHTFTSAILQERPITLYNNGNMKRDFTYITDVVSGIVAALKKPLGFTIFNIGNDTPVKLIDYIRAIESASGKKAIISFKPLQAGDVVDTHADIRKARKLLGYNPKTGIKEGMKNFMEWYRKYYKI
ncbi:MAG: SDR family NAD(P)-dependent oxidoreductase [Parcubacteria group bacterium]|nr:SDR family NAD(P)-dependent oxidoreductase [Parcubacteria group bacterium]